MKYPTVRLLKKKPHPQLFLSLNALKIVQEDFYAPGGQKFSWFFWCECNSLYLYS